MKCSSASLQLAYSLRHRSIVVGLLFCAFRSISSSIFGRNSAQCMLPHTQNNKIISVFQSQTFFAVAFAQSISFRSFLFSDTDDSIVLKSIITMRTDRSNVRGNRDALRLRRLHAASSSTCSPINHNNNNNNNRIESEHYPRINIDAAAAALACYRAFDLL